MSQSETKTMPEAVETYYANYMEMHLTLTDAKEWIPKGEHVDIREYVSKDAYSALKAECERLTEEVLTQDRTIDSLQGYLTNLVDKKNAALVAEIKELKWRLKGLEK